MSALGLMLDLQALQCPHFGERGIARYVASHAVALLQHPDIVRKIFLHPLSPLPIKLPAALRSSPLLCWQTAAEMRAGTDAGPVALHMMSPFNVNGSSLAQYPPAEIPMIATVYDLIPLLYPEQYFPRERDRTFYLARAGILRRADLLLSISESARQDAIVHLGVSPDIIVNIGAGIDEHFKPLRAGETLPEEVFKDLGLDGPYVLAVLGDDARKNLSGLLVAMARLSVDVSADIKLVVVGNYSEEAMQRYRQLPAASRFAHRLVFAGRVSDDLLVALYQGALLHVFPSFYEGFGLPTAEAAACGCPSITSNTSSLPEVLNLPEATFDPTDPDEMAALISRTICDTAFREMLIQRGLAEVAKHSWARVAQRTVDAVSASAAAGRLGRRIRLGSTSKPRVALVGPMPPAHSGIADYNERVCRALQRYCRLDLFISHSGSEHPPTLYGCRCYRANSLRDLLDPYAYDALIYTFGNSEHHHETFELCCTFPGWVWLHEVRLPGLFCTYAEDRMDAGRAADFMQDSLARQYSTRMPLLSAPDDSLDPHFLRERDVGLNDLLVRHARGIILHSPHAEHMLRRDLPPGMALPPVSIIPLAFPAARPDHKRIFATPWLVGHFGIVDPVKYPALLISAFAQRKQADADLVFVGPVESALRAELEQLAASLGVADRVTFTGQVSADAYQKWLGSVDLAVQLRAVSNGESSAAVNDAVAAGVPVITNMPCVEQWPREAVCRLSVTPTADELHAEMERMLLPEMLSAQSAAGLALARENTADTVALRLLDAVGVPIPASARTGDGQAPAGVERKRALYFLHIPKTAGTSFMKILDSQYDPAEICPAHLWRDLLRLLPQSLHYSVFRGHFYAYLATHLPRHELRTITFVRNPVERALSQYRHILREPGHYFHKRALALGSLAAFMRDPETGPLLWNAQTRALALNLNPVHMACGLGRKGLDALELERQLETYMPPAGEEMILLERAKAMLDGCACVGITEQFRVSVHLIAKCVGWSLPVGSVPHLRQSTERDKYRPTPEEMRRLAEINSLDEALYAHARQLFEHEVAEGGLNLGASRKHAY